MKKFFIFIFSIVFSMGVMAETVTLTADDFVSTSYAANDGDHSITASNGSVYVFKTFDVMQNKYKQIQMRKQTNAYILPPTNIIVDSIVVNLGTSQYMNLSADIDGENIAATKVNDSIYYFSPGNYTELKLTNTSNYAASQKEITFYFHDVATSIEKTSNLNPAKVFIKNNQILISDGKNWYTLTGQLVNNDKINHN